MAKHSTEKTFRNRAAAYVTRTNKENAFHNRRRANLRKINLESNKAKSKGQVNALVANTQKGGSAAPRTMVK
jgi:hypothetical protein